MTQFKNNLCTPNLKSNSKCLMCLSPNQDILAYNCEESACCSLPFPIIADSKRELAVALGMLDPDEKDKDGMPLTARCVGFLGAAFKLLSTLMPTERNPLRLHSLSLCLSVGVYHWPRQKAETVPPLPGHHRTQLR